MKEGQVHRQVGAFVRHIHEYPVYIQRDGQLLLALPDKDLLFGFARLHLATHELPQKAPGLVGRALANQEFVFVPDQCYNYFRHWLSFVLLRAITASKLSKMKVCAAWLYTTTW